MTDYYAGEPVAHVALTEEAQGLFASGGLCVPVMPRYDWLGFYHEPWRGPDYPPWPSQARVHRWLFPRWTRAAHRLAEARSRLTFAAGVLRRGIPPERQDDW